MQIIIHVRNTFGHYASHCAPGRHMWPKAEDACGGLYTNPKDNILQRSSCVIFALVPRLSSGEENVHKKGQKPNFQFSPGNMTGDAPEGRGERGAQLKTLQV